MFFTRICNVRNSFEFFAIDRLLHSQVLLRHFPWRKFRNLPLIGNSHYQVSPIHHETSLRTLRNAHFRREERLNDEAKFVALHSKRFIGFPRSIVRRNLTFSTLEKTENDHNPIFEYPAGGSPSGCPARSSTETDFQDLDIRTMSSLDLMKSKTTRPLASSLSNSLQVLILLWHVLLLILVEFVLHCSSASCGTEMAKFNKHKWFHSSRVKFPLVKMSASWFLVSMYLIWILVSRLIR